MPPLASDLRRQLANVVVQARDLTEAAARAALKRWAVDIVKPFDHFSAADKELDRTRTAAANQLDRTNWIGKLDKAGWNTKWIGHAQQPRTR